MTTHRTVKDPKMADGEISPKVSLPALALFIVGAVLVIAHFVVDDAGGTLLDVGLSAIGASGVTAGVGYTAKVGAVKVPAA